MFINFILMKTQSKLAAFFFALLSLTSVYAQNTAGNKFENAIQAFEKQDLASRPEPGGNLFVGSSTVTRWKDIADYFPGRHVLNRGFGGSQFSDLLLYVDRIIVPYRPARVFVYEGDNDIASGKKPEDIVRQAGELNELIKKALPKTEVIFLSAKPSMTRWHLKETYETYNRLLKDYVKKARRTRYIDIWTPLLDEAGNLNPAVYAEDKLHLNAEGYRTIQPVIAPFLK